VNCLVCRHEIEFVMGTWWSFSYSGQTGVLCQIGPGGVAYHVPDRVSEEAVIKWVISDLRLIEASTRETAGQDASFARDKETDSRCCTHRPSM
jgi:hypothetical protein